MTNVNFQNIEEYNDIKTINQYMSRRKEGVSHEETMKVIGPFSRDNSRTPMQWNDSVNAGFSTEKPWIGVNPNYTEINVAVQQKDSNSILNFYKMMIALRKKSNVLIYGSYDLILEENKQIFAYTRTLGDHKVVVICNLTAKEATYDYKGFKLAYDDILLSNYKVETHEEMSNFTLGPYEARMYKINS